MAKATFSRGDLYGRLKPPAPSDAGCAGSFIGLNAASPHAHFPKWMAGFMCGLKGLRKKSGRDRTKLATSVLPSTVHNSPILVHISTACSKTFHKKQSQISDFSRNPSPCISTFRKKRTDVPVPFLSHTDESNDSPHIPVLKKRVRLPAAVQNALPRFSTRSHELGARS